VKVYILANAEAGEKGGSERIAATLYCLGTGFVSGIYG
jgi:hypothetical protein